MSRPEDAQVNEETRTVHLPKYFGHLIVEWKITNFCLRTCKENYFIESKEFYIGGATFTKWKMILNPKTIGQTISIFLRRLKLEPGPEKVTVKWRFALSGKSKRDRYVVKEGCDILKMDSSCIINMKETENVFKKLRPFDSDELNLYCHMIVIHEKNNTYVHKTSDNGIKLLSEELMDLYNKGYLYDIVLKTSGKSIKAHKAILHSRNSKFAELLIHENKEIDLSQFKYEAIDKILYYIYTGDIQYFLTEPSIGLYDCMFFFKVPDIALLYTPDELFFHTTVDVQEISYLWSISNFFSSKNFESPILDEDSNTTWQIHASSHVIDGRECVGFDAELIEGPNSQGICIEFGVVDADQNTFCLNRILKYVDKMVLTDRKFFVTRLRQEIDPYIENGNLHVVVRIRMAPGTYSITSGNSVTRFQSAITTYDQYLRLSVSIVSLMDSDQFSDITLRTNEGVFKCHKCILFARSACFFREIRKMKKEENEIRVNISSSELDSMLLYIYSGRLILPDNTDYTFYPTTSIAADYLGIQSCKFSASKAMRQLISVSNVCPILIYADKFRDVKLKAAAMSFIIENFIAVCEEQTWINLTKSNPLLFKEVKLFTSETAINK